MKGVLDGGNDVPNKLSYQEVITPLRSGSRKRIEARYRKSGRLAESNGAPLPLARGSGAL
jgi:hypothetical protein